MGEIPASPPPPPPVASSGSNTGAAMAAPLALSALQGLGGGGGGNSGGGDDKNDAPNSVDEKDVNSLGHDRTGLLRGSEMAIGKMTLQAAFSHLRKNGEVMAPGPSDLAALKKALKEHGLVSGGGGARIENFAAAEAALEHIGNLDSGDLSDYAIGSKLGFPRIADERIDPFQDLMEEVDTAALVRAFDRAVLAPARNFHELSITAELQPETEGEFTRLRNLVFDPRAGFAPEGLAAWDLEKSSGVTLHTASSGRSDYTEVESGIAWSVLPLSNNDTTFSEIARCTKEADSSKSHLLVDASSVPPTPLLVNAIRNASKSFPKVRVHLAITSQG